MVTHSNFFRNKKNDEKNADLKNKQFPCLVNTSWVSRLNNLFVSYASPYLLQTIAREIETGKTTLHDLHADSPVRTIEEATEYARHLRETRGQDPYDQIKRNMPQFLPAVVCQHRNADAIEAFSGFVCLEYDDPDVDTGYAFVLACQNPHVVLAWRSLSRKPKILVRIGMTSIDGEPLTYATFPHAWVTASQLFEEIGTADTKASNALQPQNICHDPDIYLNLEAIPLDWSVDKEALKAELPEIFDALRLSLISDLSQEYLDALSEMKYREDGIGTQRLPCPFTEHEFDGWGVRANATRVTRHADNDYTLQCFKCGKRKRYNLTATETPRYHLNGDFNHNTSTMEAERAANKTAILDWTNTTQDTTATELLIMSSAAGTAKTTIAITTPEQLFYISKTVEEADQVFKKLFDAGEDAIRHRPRLYNRDHEDWDTLPLGLGANERPCIKPELCNLYAERGHPTHEICRRCPVYLDCKENAWLSQDDKERDAQKVIYAWGETVACDAIHSARVKRICTADDIMVVDEVNPANLTQHRSVTRDVFYDIIERFRDPNTLTEYEALKPLLDIISTAETPIDFLRKLKTHLETIADLRELDDKLQKYPVGYVFENASHPSYNFTATLHYRGKEVTVPVVSYETDDDTPVFEIDADTPLTVGTWQLSLMPLSFLIKVGLVSLDDPPRRYQNLLSDMQRFIEEHPEFENAPFEYDPKAQTFDFHLKPTLNHRRVIFNSASDTDNLIGAAYSDTRINITRHTGTPPAWKTDLVFQIATGNYLPRHSLLGYTGEGDNKTLHLKPRAQELIDAYIQPSIETGLKVLVVAPKAFLKVEGVKKWAVRKIKDFQLGRNAMLINHHHAEGRNDFQDFDISFIFHYEPEHQSIQQDTKRIFRNPKTPLNFDREKQIVTVGAVSFEKVVYLDKRVQAVYNRECRARMMQSPMRLRPNINDGKIIVFLTAEPVDIPVTPIPLTLNDAEHFDGDWEAFALKLQAKLKATEAGDVKALINTGMSERNAYIRTEAVRKQNKAERNAEICQRFSTGQSKKQIATEMKLSQDTVKRVLNDQQF